MTGAAAWLVGASFGAFYAGAFLWMFLFLREVWRDPAGRDIFSWSLNRQWAVNARAMRAAIDRGGFWPRLATLLLAASIAGFLAAGALALFTAFAGGPG